MQNTCPVCRTAVNTTALSCVVILLVNSAQFLHNQKARCFEMIQNRTPKVILKIS